MLMNQEQELKTTFGDRLVFGRRIVRHVMTLTSIVMLVAMTMMNGVVYGNDGNSCMMGELCTVSKWFNIDNETAMSRTFFFPSSMSELASVNLNFLLPIVVGNSSESLFDFEVNKNCDGKCFSMIDNSTHYLLDSFAFNFPESSFKFNNSYNSKMIFHITDSIGVLNVDPKSIQIIVKNNEAVIDSANLKDGLQFDLRKIQELKIENITIQIVTNSKPTEKKIQMGENVNVSYRSSFLLSLKQFTDRKMRLEFSQPKIPIQFIINPYRSQDMIFNSNSAGNNGVYAFLDALEFNFKTNNGSATNVASLLTAEYVFESINSTRTDINGKQVTLLDDTNSLLVAKQYQGVFYKYSYSNLASNSSTILEFDLNLMENKTVFSIMGQTASKPSPIIHKVYEQINGTIHVGENIYFAIPISSSRKLVMEGNFNTLSKTDETKLEIYVQDDVYDSIPLPTPDSFSEKFTLLPKQDTRKFNLPISEATKNIAFLLQCSSNDPSEKCSFSFQVYSPSPAHDLVVPLAVSFSVIGALLVLGLIISVTAIYCRIYRKKSYVNLI